jgi:predicted signal transduction protein with EAL and GGDEF domain
VASRSGTDAADIDGLLAEADAALYAAKKAGRGGHVHFLELDRYQRLDEGDAPC